MKITSRYGEKKGKNRIYHSEKKRIEILKFITTYVTPLGACEIMHKIPIVFFILYSSESSPDGRIVLRDIWNNAAIYRATVYPIFFFSVPLKFEIYSDGIWDLGSGIWDLGSGIVDPEKCWEDFAWKLKTVWFCGCCVCYSLFSVFGIMLCFLLPISYPNIYRGPYKLHNFQLSTFNSCTHDPCTSDREFNW